MHRLSPAKVRTAKLGMWCDGGGLYLQVTAGVNGEFRKSWLFRFATGKIALSRSGKPRREERQMGLGSLDTVSLAEARDRAAAARRLREQGIDPIDEKRDRRAAQALAAAKSMNFDQCRDAYLADNRAGWRNAKHATQWMATLTTYVAPIFGKLPVQTIDVALVLKVLRPIWTTKPETASRVRGRVERILDWAKVNGYRGGENPARWRGHLDHLLPSRTKVRAVTHHPALPYAEIGSFVAKLRERDAVAARALQFLILTAARTGEVLGMHWDEIDVEARLWTIPASRMKAGREHRVPLSGPAIAVIKQMLTIRENEYVFPGERGAMLSNMSMHMLLRRMGRNDVTVHGFRSTFRDWAAELTSFPPELAELTLAHSVGNKVETAYRRTDLFGKRRELMHAWALHCGRPAL
jgi:integrase